MNPKNLEEAVNYVISNDPSLELEKWAAMEEDDAVCGIHFHGGMKLRNDLELWHDSDLAKWFNTIGITHPDDMSGIIFTSIHRRLNKKERELDKQVKFYQDFWKKNGYVDGIPTKG